MVIDSISVYHVRMPLIYPFRTAFGNNEAIDSVLVKMSAGGCYGWGEAAPWGEPAYSPEWTGGAFQVIKTFLGPLLLGENITSGRILQDRLAVVKANYFAKGALDLAWWDLYARSLGEPLWKTLGGERDTVDVGADFGVMDSIGQLVETIGEAVNRGYKRVKLKYRPGWELEMVREVRKAFPETVFHVDCNSAYTLEHIDMFKELDKYDMAMIEQPLMHDDLIDHARLQREVSTPICLDESITSPVRTRQAIEIKACGYINVKPGRVGGLTQAKAIHDICVSGEIPCWVGGMLESSIGAYHCLALATLPNFSYPNDIFPSDRFYETDLCEPAVCLSGTSCIKALDSPGCGTEPNPKRLSELTLDKAILR